MNKDQIEHVIENALYCHLACAIQGEPYLVPLAYGYEGDSVFIHTARSGKKIDLFSTNPQVCLGFEVDVSLAADPDSACDWSFEYQSVIASGLIEEMISPDEKTAGLSVIMAHYSNKVWDFSPEELANTRVWRIRITEFSGKESKE